jgi:hypothetical protein
VVIRLNTTLKKYKMRELKFRVWLDNLEEMINSWHYENEDTGGLSDFFGEIYPLDHGDVLMSYTGLNDGDGQDIYENDILMINDHKYIIKWSEKLARYYVENTDGSIHDITEDFDKRNVVVLGNIFENKELLS